MNLLESLRSCVQDERDIEPIIALAAGGGAGYILNGPVEYHSSNQLFARVTFKSGRITKFEPGALLQTPKAQRELIAQTKEQAAYKHGTFVSLRVLFSERKLNGYYAWGDKFRISPCPAEAPIGQGLDFFADIMGRESQHKGPPFPFLLEVRSQRSPNCFIESNRTLRDLDTYQQILTLLLNGRLRYIHWSSDRVWVGLKQEESIKYHLLHSGFDFGESGRVDDFPQRANAPAKKYSGLVDYYNHLWGQDKELLIPESLDDDLSAIHTFSTQEMEKFKRAVYWYSLGIQFIQEPSLSTVAFSTAIECLLPNVRSPKCPECKKDTIGPTHLFKQHIKRYGKVIGALEKSRDKLYDVRSKLVHGSHAAQVDIDFMSAAKHSDDYLLLLQIVSQRSLIGWIRDSARVGRNN